MINAPTPSPAVRTLKLSKPQYAIYHSRHQLNLFMGGQGCGKTTLMAFLAARFIQEFPDVLGLIAANTYLQLTVSTMKRILETWERCFDLKEYKEGSNEGHYVIGKRPPPHFKESVHKFVKYDHVISFSWGAALIIGSLENYGAFDGTEFGWELLDETKDTREQAVQDVLIGRLRAQGIYMEVGDGDKGQMTSSPFAADGTPNQPFMPLYIFTSPAKVPWLNEFFGLPPYEAEIRSLIYYPPKFFKRNTTENKFVVIGAAHLNKRNLPSNFIQNQQANLVKEKHGMLIYGDPFSQTGGEFVKCWREEKHVGKVAHTYDPEEPLHLTFDFNSVPYITCVAYQVKGKAVREIVEFPLGTPKNTTPALCQVLGKYFQNQKAKVYIYGDPSGNSRNRGTTTLEKRSDFDVIKASLPFKIVDRVLKSAPSVSISRDFLDLILEQEYAGISLVVDEQCVKTRDDFKYAKEAADGGMEKKRVKDPETGVYYEPYGHILDAKRYFFVSIFQKDYLAYTGKPTSGSKVGNRRESKNSY